MLKLVLLFVFAAVATARPRQVFYSDDLRPSSGNGFYVSFDGPFSGTAQGYGPLLDTNNQQGTGWGQHQQFFDQGPGGNQFGVGGEEIDYQDYNDGVQLGRRGFGDDPVYGTEVNGPVLVSDDGNTGTFIMGSDPQDFGGFQLTW